MELLIFPEDGSKYASGILERLFELAGGAALGGPFPSSYVKYSASPNSAARSARWMSVKNAGDVRDRGDMCRHMAEHISRGPGAFVLFHFDADCRWSDRKKSVARQERFHRDIVLTVARLPRDPCRPQGDPLGVELVQSRLIVMIPFWCLESWLYCNAPEALAELQCSANGFDDVERPWDKCTLRKSRNQLLVQKLNGHALVGFSPSFSAFVDDLRGRAELVAELTRGRCE